MAIQNITPDKLDQLIKSGQNIALIDVVDPTSFAERHIAGSVNLPLKTLAPAAVIQFRGAASDEPLYVICQAGISSKIACEQFITAGFDQAVNVKGGKIAWEKAGLPLTRQPKSVFKGQGLRLLCGGGVLIGSILAALVHPVFLALPLTAGGVLLFSGLFRG